MKFMFNDCQVHTQFTSFLFFHLYTLILFFLVVHDLSFPNEMHCVLKETINFFASLIKLEVGLSKLSKV